MWAPQGQNLGVGASRLGRSQKLMATGHDRQHRQQNPVEDQVGDFMGLDMETDGTQRHDHQPQGGQQCQPEEEAIHRGKDHAPEASNSAHPYTGAGRQAGYSDSPCRRPSNWAGTGPACHKTGRPRPGPITRSRDQ